MRAYYLLALAALGACNLATLDPEALVVERAPIGALDCGQSSFWDDLPPYPVRECVLGAIADGQPFFAIVDEAVFDGRLTVGYAYDGAAFLKLDYEAAYGQFPGMDSEALSWTACAWLESRGADCPTLTRDLCLGCVGATPIR
ncbi:MAG TPA: hypothetical protein VM261_09360 [Kofleriaceae bacterium]|nr:hypothetical protein [Kofleriaceae bacterium]